MLLKRAERLYRPLQSRPQAVKDTGDAGLRKLVRTELPVKEHVLERLSRKTAGACMACTAYGRTKRSEYRAGNRGGRKRIPLRESDGNSQLLEHGKVVQMRASRSHYSYLQCNLNLCRSGPCWSGHLKFCK